MPIRTEWLHDNDEALVTTDTRAYLVTIQPNPIPGAGWTATARTLVPQAPRGLWKLSAPRTVGHWASEAEARLSAPTAALSVEVAA